MSESPQTRENEEEQEREEETMMHSVEIDIVVFTRDMLVRWWRSALLLSEDVNGVEFEVQPSDIELVGHFFSFDDKEDEEEFEFEVQPSDFELEGHVFIFYDEEDEEEHVFIFNDEEDAEEFLDYALAAAAAAAADDDDGVEEFDSEAAAARLKTVEIEPAEHWKTCSICLEELEEGREAVAMHKFHKDCLLPWLASKKTCPYCRFQLR